MTTQIGSHFCLFYSQKKGPRDIEIVGIKAQIASAATVQWHSGWGEWYKGYKEF